jgi:hypothetical protein
LTQRADWGESGYFRIVYSEVNGTTRFGNEIYTLYQGANYQCSALPVRIAETNTYHSTIASAYAAALDGQTIQTRHTPPFEEDLFSNRNILLKLRGGHDCSFSVNNSNISNIGPITIDAGSLIIDGIEIE